MKKYNVEFTQQELEILTGLLNIAVKAQGLVGNTDVAARTILNKITQGEVKEAVEKQ